jgi:hypothetical protein
MWRLKERIREWRENYLPLPLLADLLRKHGVLRPGLSYKAGDFHGVTFEKNNGRLHVRLGKSGERQEFWYWTSRRLPVFARIVEMTSARHLHVDANLHDFWDVPGVMTACSKELRAILVPDPDFYNSGGYAELRTRACTAPAWMKRSDVILWRGSTTGGVVRSLGSSDDLSDPDTLPRIRMCSLLRGLPQVDARIVSVVQTSNPVGLTAILRSAGLMAEWMPEERWIEHKFAIDIDGNSNSWSNLFRSLLLGCCVIKISSPRGYRQWYYDRLLPFEHYVPVRADMSDLYQQIEWCRDNIGFCGQIAANGQMFASSMVLQEELTDAGRRLELAQLAGPASGEEC